MMYDMKRHLLRMKKLGKLKGTIRKFAKAGALAAAPPAQGGDKQAPQPRIPKGGGVD